MAKKITIPSSFILLLLLPILANAQMSKLSSDKQLLLLQLSLNYYTVVKEGIVDQDSSLLIVSKKDHLSRWTVITEGFGDNIAISNARWIDKRDIKTPVNQLSALHGIDHAKLLVLLGAYYAFQPGYHQKDRDSASYFLSKAKQESEQLNATFWLNQSLCLMGKNYFKGNQVKEGTDCFTNLINSCQKTGNKVMEAKAWDYQGSYIPPAAPTIMLKINSIKKANDLYQQLNQPDKQINTLMNMGYLDFLVTDNKGAETNALKALMLQDTINFPYKHYTTDLLSMIYNVKGDVAKQMNYALMSVKTSESTKDNLELPFFYGRVGTIPYGIGKKRFEFSIYWLQKSVKEFAKNNDPSIYKVIPDLINFYNVTGKFSEAVFLLNKTIKNIAPVDPIDKEMAYSALAANYRGLKQYNQAEKKYLAAYALLKEDKVVTRDAHLAYLEYQLGVLYMEMQQYEKAKIYFQKCLTYKGPEQVIMPLMLTDIYKSLYQIDSIKENYQSAISHLKQYITTENKYRDLNDAKNIASLKVTYEMSQKEKDLQVLQAKSILQSQQANTTRKFIYLGIVAAFLIISMLYSRYYINKKQKREMDKKNSLLQQVISEKDELLTSKEWLLKEVHHRVKNNLHTVICLLESQAAYLENDALKAIENSQHRIYAMSLIHQKLYQSEDIKTIDMAVYLPEFVRYLNESFGTTSQIRFELDIKPLKLGVSYAVPLSLIINEAVTNSIKYAFPDSKKGIINISMHKIDNQVDLIIADNGIGIKPNKLNGQADSLGLKLLRGLSEDIKADIIIKNNNGTKIIIKFKIDELMYTVMA